MQLRHRLDDPFANKVRVGEINASLEEFMDEYKYIKENKDSIKSIRFIEE